MDKISTFRVRVKDIVFYICTILISAVVIGIATIPFTSLFNNSEMMMIQYTLMFSLSILLTLKYRSRMAQKRGFISKTPPLGQLKPIYLLIGIVYMCAESVFSEPIINLMPQAIDEYTKMFSDIPPIQALLVGVIIGPIIEEFFFRGIILRDIASRWGVKKGIIISAILFGVIHINGVQIITATLGGLFWGYVYYKTNFSLKTVSAMHILNNLVAFASMHFLDDTEETMLIDYLGKPLFTVLFVISSIVIAYIIYRICRIKQNDCLVREENIKIE